MSEKKTSVKIDLKKQFPDFYDASRKEVQEVVVPSMNFFMIDGKGNPNDNIAFQKAVQALYAHSYGLKMNFKKTPKGRDYVVPPLEGLWYMPNMAEWTMDHKEKWQWTLIFK